jgi:DNA-binding PadR family transcriptional regulator
MTMTTTLQFDIPPSITDLPLRRVPAAASTAAPQAAPPSAGRKSPADAARLPDAAYVVLGYVGRYPTGVHGYELGRVLSRSPLRVPSMQLGQLYRALQRLERAGLVQRHVETESSRLRYRFTVTKQGARAFERWLSAIPGDSGQACEQLLERLRFADHMPSETVLRLVDTAARQCREGIEELAAHAGDEEAVGAYALALKARLADGRCWLEEVRRIVRETAAEAEAKTSAKASVGPSGRA